jgi:hypothetical protein
MEDKQSGCISADQRAKDERATHQLDNLKSSNNLLTLVKKVRKCGFNLPTVNKIIA